MRKLIGLIVCFVLGFSGFAQETTFSPLAEELQVKNTDLGKVNLYLNLQGRYKQSLSKDTKLGNFEFKNFLVELRGSVTDRMNYYWVQQFNNDNQKGIDNILKGINVAAIDYQLTQSLRVLAGRQVVAYGGQEFYFRPIDVVQYSDITNNTRSYLTGASLIYTPNKSNEFIFQLVNSDNTTFEYAYPGRLEKPADLPLMFTVNWNGSLFNNNFKPRYSASFMPQSDKHNRFYFALGNDIRFSSKFQMYLDVMYSRDGLDYHGKASEMLFGVDCAEDIEYFSVVSRLLYEFTPGFQFLVKGMYETTALTSNKNLGVESGRLGYTYAYLAGFNYFPKTENFNMFLMYGNRHDHQNLLDQTFTSPKIYLGFTYRLKAF